MTHTFQIDHLGIAVKSLSSAKAIYEKLGLSVSPEETVEHEQVKLVMVPVGESRLELLEAHFPGLDHRQIHCQARRRPASRLPESSRPAPPPSRASRPMACAWFPKRSRSAQAGTVTSSFTREHRWRAAGVGAGLNYAQPERSA